MRNNHSNGMSRHHIVPQSRCDGHNLGERNVALITKIEHEAYHTLFSNMTPSEAIIHLVNRFCNGDTNWIWVALSKVQD